MKDLTKRCIYIYNAEFTAVVMLVRTTVEIESNAMNSGRIKILLRQNSFAL